MSRGEPTGLRRLLSPRLTTVLCTVLLFAGLVADLSSDQALVVAITYNIPIALSGLLLSRNATLTFIALALLADVTAAFDNARGMGGFDEFTLANRGLAALTYLLVGALSLAFEHAGEEIEELSEAEEQLRRERDIRRLLTSVSGPLTPEELVATAAAGLVDLLEADAVVIAALDQDDRFTEPRVAVPAYATVARAGTAASWAVDALPVTTTPVITVRDDTGIRTVGRWRCRCGPDLVVIAERPRRSRASELLGEALTGLEPLRERAIATEEATG